MNTTTQIDLTLFCDEPGGRYALDAPFVQGGMRCATDGKLAVRIPASGEPDTDDGGRRPKLAMIFDRFCDVTEWTPLPDAPECENCKGKGSVSEECHHCRGLCRCECSCGDSHDCGACEGEGQETSDCYRDRVTISGRHLSCNVYWRIKTLPGIKYGFFPGAKLDDLIYGTFDGGGQVCFMPLSSK
jgi:hypothetical protein